MLNWLLRTMMWSIDSEWTWNDYELASESTLWQTDWLSGGHVHPASYSMVMNRLSPDCDSRSHRHDSYNLWYNWCRYLWTVDKPIRGTPLLSLKSLNGSFGDDCHHQMTLQTVKTTPYKHIILGTLKNTWYTLMWWANRMNHFKDGIKVNEICAVQ